ncbi:hypothetical protein V6N11_014403 [Hibiscus sabdariffa]|uniref:Uncharacterized protein n=1 Tax=Hibiscus sabdariffa TaxID=183260 RepID=A0ABR2NFP0_9ROSI
MKLNDGVDDQKTNEKGKSKALVSHVADFSSSKEEYLIEVISEMLVELSKGDGVSTFEFIGNIAPMTVLVQKLQNALSSVERFHVVLSHSSRSSSGGARLSSGLSALSQAFKLRLCRAQ